MNSDARIFICTHTDFDCPVHNPVYEIVDARNINGDVCENGLLGTFYSELMTYKWLADRQEDLPDYVGFCGYRKYFDFMDNVPDISEILSEYDCITTNIHHVKGSVYAQYRRGFNPFDMDIAMAVIRCSYPDFWPTFKSMLEGEYLYTCNMFIMKKEQFVEMMGVVWDILDRWIDVVGTDINGRIEQYSQIYLRRNDLAGTPYFQYRIGGNIGERIISAYIMWRFKNVKTYKMVVTEIAKRNASWE